jgi:short-subunit dehydrogenase
VFIHVWIYVSVLYFLKKAYVFRFGNCLIRRNVQDDLYVVSVMPCPTRVNKFDAFHRNSTDSSRSEFKNHRNTVHCFKISKKDKNQQKYVKKTRSNSKVTGEEIFCKNRSFGLIKFKFCQIYLNLLKRVRWNQLFITHLLFIRPNYRPIRPIFVF